MTGTPETSAEVGRMNANKQDAGGLPELPKGDVAFREDCLSKWQYAHSDEQMRAYGELCRAAPAGGDDLYRQACDSVEEWKARALEAEADIARIHAQINAENGPTFMGEPVVSAPAGSGEVTDEMVEAAYSAWQDAVRADRSMGNREAIRDALEAALLRKLQQGAES